MKKFEKHTPKIAAYKSSKFLEITLANSSRVRKIFIFLVRYDFNTVNFYISYFILYGYM